MGGAIRTGNEHMYSSKITQDCSIKGIPRCTIPHIMNIFDGTKYQRLVHVE